MAKMKIECNVCGDTEVQISLRTGLCHDCEITMIGDQAGDEYGCDYAESRKQENASNIK